MEDETPLEDGEAPLEADQAVGSAADPPAVDGGGAGGANGAEEGLVDQLWENTEELIDSAVSFYKFFCSHDHPVSAKWKRNRVVGRLVGLLLGVCVPFVLSVLCLGKGDVFRGSAMSARIMIGEQMMDLKRTGATSSPAASRAIKSIEETMDPKCWELARDAFVNCSTKTGTVSHAQLTLGIAPTTYNPWGTALGTVMFGLLFLTWFNISSSASVNNKLDKIAQKALETFGDTLQTVASVAQDAVADAVQQAPAQSPQPGGEDGSQQSYTRARQQARAEWSQSPVAAKVAKQFVLFCVFCCAGFSTVDMLDGLSIDRFFGNFSVSFEAGWDEVGVTRPDLEYADMSTRLMNVQIDEVIEDNPASVFEDEIDHRRDRSQLLRLGATLARVMLSFGIGLLCGGGLVGAPVGFAMATVDETGVVIGGHLWPFVMFALIGSCFGVICVMLELSLNNAADSLADPSVRSRAWYEDRLQLKNLTGEDEAEYFQVQFHKLKREREAGFRSDIVQLVVVFICSLCWDVFVVVFHILRPPHPKHRLRWNRRLSIYTHIFSGCGEIVCAVLSFYYYDEGLPNDHFRMRVTYMTACCSFMHAVTGAYQTPNVFGMQCIMVPAYGVVVLWKVVKATQLVLDPESLLKLTELFFIHHIYVWCRAFVFIFEQMGIFEEITYTIAIMFAGFVCGPLTMGPAGNLVVMGSISVYNFLLLPYRGTFDEDGNPIVTPDSYRIERRMNMFLNSKWRHHIDKLESRLSAAKSQRSQFVSASQGSNPADFIRNEATVTAPSTLKISKLTEFIDDPDKPGEYLCRVKEPLSRDATTGKALQEPEGAFQPVTDAQKRLIEGQKDEIDGIEGETRRRMFKSGAVVKTINCQVGDVVDPCEPVLSIEQSVRRAEMPNCNTIFDAIDYNRNGSLEVEELVDVLVSWGLTQTQSEDVFRLLDVEGRGEDLYHRRVTREEFREAWEPIWRYQVVNIEAAVNKYRRFASQEVKREAEKDERMLDLVQNFNEKKANTNEYRKKRGLNELDQAVANGTIVDSSDSTEEDLGTSEEEAAPPKAAFCVADRTALDIDDHDELMFEHLGCSCMPWFANSGDFLAAKDGEAGVFTMPGWLGIVDFVLFSAACPVFLVAIFDVDSHMDMDLTDETRRLMCFAGFAMLPRYVMDLCTMDVRVMGLVFRQIEAQLLMLYNLFFCISLNILVGWDDIRTMLIWTAIFPGIIVVTFSDAIAFEAQTTKRMVECALVFLALPLAVLLLLGLARNLDEPDRHYLYIDSFPKMNLAYMHQKESSIEDSIFAKAAAASELSNASMGGASFATAMTEAQEQADARMRNAVGTQTLLVQCIVVLETLIWFMAKNVFLHIFRSDYAMLLQLKVKRADTSSNPHGFKEEVKLSAEQLEELRSLLSSPGDASALKFMDTLKPKCSDTTTE